MRRHHKTNATDIHLPRSARGVVCSVLVLAAVLACPSSARAQLPTTKVLTMDVAELIAQGALEKCRADGLKITVIVVDGRNAPKVLIRDDGATAATAEAARMKATTAVLYERPSGPTNPPPAGTPVPAAPIPGTFQAQGGVPIMVDGVTIGAVGVSATQNPRGGQEHDAACASAGIAKASSKLR